MPYEASQGHLNGKTVAYRSLYPCPGLGYSKRLLSSHRNGSIYKGGSVFEKRSERTTGILGKYVG